ncbi:hypothetical protein EC973_008546 [Apophysomyces ossiformis]|uniref:Monooxygenase n=1 Tax=Apophysomyces ossiformis TaxID=679940 RepID=A0A8H7BNG6_9FUNG|nr:hypothetical protein EC973_008546 [Apophysomyces ossiformis]
MVGRLEAQGRGELAHKLIPEYLPGCKRLTLSDEYLESLCRSNVTVERSAIREIRGRTIVCENGNETEFDILCLATGFNVQGFLGNLQIYGRNNQSLNDLWKNGYPETYKSINIHGFPNFFLLLGPASAFGHHSAVSVIESNFSVLNNSQVNFAIKTIKYMRKHQITSFEPKKEAQEKFVEGLRKAHQSTVWSSGCKSWYMDAKGQIVSLWPGTIISFMWALYRTSYTSDYICNRSTPK